MRDGLWYAVQHLICSLSCSECVKCSVLCIGVTNVKKNSRCIFDWELRFLLDGVIRALIKSYLFVRLLKAVIRVFFFTEKVKKNNHALLKCNYQITATNRPRKKMSSTEKRNLHVTDVYHK